MEKSHFLGDWWFFKWFLVILLVGTGEPLPYCNKNTLGKIESKFGIGRPPPPSVGTKDQIFRQIQFEGSPILYWKLNFQYNITIYIWVRKYPGVMQAKANWREWVPRARPGTLKPLTWKSSSPTMGWRRETWSRVQEQQPLKVELLWLKKYIS